MHLHKEVGALNDANCVRTLYSAIVGPHLTCLLNSHIKDVICQYIKTVATFGLVHRALRFGDSTKSRHGGYAALYQS